MSNPWLIDANFRRHTEGAQAQLDRARNALKVLESHTPKNDGERRRYDHHRTVLHDRLLYTQLTVTEIADKHDMTKNRYWGKLRRAYEYAERVERRRR